MLLVAEPEPAAEFGDDALGDAQTQPGALLFGGEKRLKYFFAQVGGDTGAVVAHGHPEAGGVGDRGRHRLRQLEREMRQRHAARTGSKLNAKAGTSADYCSRCGMLRSQCDCWDPVNQE